MGFQNQHVVCALPRFMRSRSGSCCGCAQAHADLPRSGASYFERLSVHRVVFALRAASRAPASPFVVAQVQMGLNIYHHLHSARAPLRAGALSAPNGEQAVCTSQCWLPQPMLVFIRRCESRRPLFDPPTPPSGPFGLLGLTRTAQGFVAEPLCVCGSREPGAQPNA